MHTELDGYRIYNLGGLGDDDPVRELVAGDLGAALGISKGDTRFASRSSPVTWSADLRRHLAVAGANSATSAAGAAAGRICDAVRRVVSSTFERPLAVEGSPAARRMNGEVPGHRRRGIHRFAPGHAHCCWSQGDGVVVLDNFASGQPPQPRRAPRAADSRSVEGSDHRHGRRAAGYRRLRRACSTSRRCRRSRAASRRSAGVARPPTPPGSVVTVLDVARRQGAPGRLRGVLVGLRRPGRRAQGRDLRERARCRPTPPPSSPASSNCRVFSHVYGLPVVVTRFFNVFGPRQVPDSPYSGVVAAFCFALLRGERAGRASTARRKAVPGLHLRRPTSPAA